jgi:hypothetical protein
MGRLMFTVFTISSITCFIPLFVGSKLNKGLGDGDTLLFAGATSRTYCYSVVTLVVFLIPVAIDRAVDLFNHGRINQPYYVFNMHMIILVYIFSVLQLSIFVPSNDIGKIEINFLNYIYFNVCILQIEIVLCLHLGRELIFYHIGFRRLLLYRMDDPIHCCHCFLCFLLLSCSVTILCFSAFAGAYFINLIYVSIVVNAIHLIFSGIVCYTCWGEIQDMPWQKMSTLERDGYLLILVLPIMGIINFIMLVVNFGIFSEVPLTTNCYLCFVFALSRYLVERKNIIAEAEMKEAGFFTDIIFINFVT